MNAIDLAELTRLYQDHVGWLAGAYARALEATGWDGVVLHSGTPKRRSVFDDQDWPLRVVPHFQHWLPLAEPDCAVVVVPGSKPVLLKNVAHGFWERPPAPETDHFWSSFDVVEVKGPAAVKDALPQGKELAFLGEDEARAMEWGFDKGAMAPRELLSKLDALRTRKTAYERLCLAEANRRACLGHAAVLEAFQGGEHSELELHLLYLKATAQDDPETPYKNIVALGEHAATLHHVGYGKKKSDAQSLLLDAGATYQGYDSDITRTAVKGQGAAAAAFAALVHGVEALQREMCRRVRAGINYQQLHNESHELLATVLRDVGIARASEQELVDQGVTRKFLPHGLGHSLGLQTHDVGCRNVNPEPRNPFLRHTAVIEPGQVFTIEPGCYFIDEMLDDLRASPQGGAIDWRLVFELKRFGGVRIEDDLAVTDQGVENYTRVHLPG